MWGDAGGSREHWGLWFLVGAVLLGLAAAPRSAAQMRGSAARRTLVALGAGAAVAVYLSLDFFPSQMLLQAVVAAATMMMALFLVLLQLPEPPKGLPMLLLLWGGCVPAALFFAAILPLPPLPYDASRMFAEGGRSVDAERRQALRCAVVLVFAVEALVAALALKLSVTRSSRQKEGDAWGGDAVSTMQARHVGDSPVVVAFVLLPRTVLLLMHAGRPTGAIWAGHAVQGPLGLAADEHVGTAVPRAGTRSTGGPQEHAAGTGDRSRMDAHGMQRSYVHCVCGVDVPGDGAVGHAVCARVCAGAHAAAAVLRSRDAVLCWRFAGAVLFDMPRFMAADHTALSPSCGGD